jgi:hypothetical protein
VRGDKIYKTEVYKYIKSRPNEIVSTREMAMACNITIEQAKRAGYQLGRESGTSVTRIGSSSWRYTPPEENPKIELTVVEKKPKGAFVAVDQYGASYLVKPL